MKSIVNANTAFLCQRSQAKRRGIGWLLSFEAWLEIWHNSGKWDERGRSAGKFVMARHGDVGPYAVCNVKIVLHAENVKERWEVARVMGDVKGWTFVRGRYQVMVGRLYVGKYKTQAQAEHAYRSALSPHA